MIFEPRSKLPSLYAKYALQPQAKWSTADVIIEADGAAESGELLEAVLSEWIDFFFVPTPERFVIYADHDEYTTFLTNKKATLRDLAQSLTAAKFRAVKYIRDFKV
jgi:hypothetical protein